MGFDVCMWEAMDGRYTGCFHTNSCEYAAPPPTGGIMVSFHRASNLFCLYPCTFHNDRRLLCHVRFLCFNCFLTYISQKNKKHSPWVAGEVTKVTNGHQITPTGLRALLGGNMGFHPLVAAPSLSGYCRHSLEYSLQRVGDGLARAGVGGTYRSGSLTIRKVYVGQMILCLSLF